MNHFGVLTSDMFLVFSRLTHSAVRAPLAGIRYVDRSKEHIELIATALLWHGDGAVSFGS